jgi:hypothetical protein
MLGQARQIRTHKTHHDPDLGEATTFLFIIYLVPLHETHIQMAFCPGPSFSHNLCFKCPNGSCKPILDIYIPTLGLPRIWGPITSCADLRLRWGLKQSYNPCREPFNGMSHTTCMQQNQVDSQLLVVESQIVNLIPGPSFGHNLCFKFPNGHASTFQTSMFQKFSNDIKNSSSHWVSIPIIAF